MSPDGPGLGSAWVGEPGRAPLELRGDRLGLVRAADEGADLLLLRGEPRFQVHPARQVQEPLGPFLPSGRRRLHFQTNPIPNQPFQTKPTNSKPNQPIPTQPTTGWTGAAGGGPAGPGFGAEPHLKEIFHFLIDPSAAHEAQAAL